MKLLKIVACLMFVAYASAACTGTGVPNGTLDLAGGEICDDGDTVNGDGCEDDCTLSCGNNTPDAANNEECDDGNQTTGDGCDNCKLEYLCTPSADPLFDTINSVNRQDLVEKSAIFAPHLDIAGSKFITDSGTKWQVSVMVSKWYTAAADQVQVHVVGQASAEDTTPGTVNVEFVTNPLQTGINDKQSRVCNSNADLTHTCAGPAACDGACVGSDRDGILDPTEECDDGNDDEDDGCNNSCVKTCFHQDQAAANLYTAVSSMPDIANPRGLGTTTAAAHADCWEMRTVRIKWAHLTHKSNGGSHQDGLAKHEDVAANAGAGTATFRGAVKVTSTRTMKGRLFGTGYTRTAIDTLYWDIVFPLTATVTFENLEIFGSIELQVVLTSHEVQLTDLLVTDNNGPTVSAKIAYTTTTQRPFKLKTGVAFNTVRTVEASGSTWVAWTAANAYLDIDTAPAAGGVKYIALGESCAYPADTTCSQNWEIKTTNINMDPSDTDGNYFVNTHNCRIDVHLEVTFNPECQSTYESQCRVGHTDESGIGEACDSADPDNSGKPCLRTTGGGCFAHPKCPLGLAATHLDIFRVRLQTSKLCPDPVTTVAFGPATIAAYSDTGRTTAKSAYILGQQVWFRAQFEVTTADAPDLATCAIDTITVDPFDSAKFSWYIYSASSGATDVWVDLSNNPNDFTTPAGVTDNKAHCRVDFSIQLYGCPDGAANKPLTGFTGGRCFDITRFTADTQNIILRVTFTFAGFLKLGKAELLQQPGEENSDQANVEIGIASDEVDVEQPTTGGDNVVSDGGQTILLEGQSSDVFIYIIIGVCAFVALLIGALVMYLRRSKKEKKSNAITPQVQVQMQPRVGVVTQQQPCMAATA